MIWLNCSKRMIQRYSQQQQSVVEFRRCLSLFAAQKVSISNQTIYSHHYEQQQQKQNERNWEPSRMLIYHSFSSLQQQQDDENVVTTSAEEAIKSFSGIVRHPPNLKFDKKSKSSPFRNVQKVEKKQPNLETETTTADLDEKDAADEEEQDPKDDQDKETSAATTTTKQDDDETEEKKEDQEDEEEDKEDQDAEEEEEDLSNVLFDMSTRPMGPTIIPLPQRCHVNILNGSNLKESVGSLWLSQKVFGRSPIRIDLLKKVVVYQRNKRRGRRYPALAKTISTVSGSGRKVRPQKGTGRARAGHSRPSHWRGGAKAHGPKGKEQNYETKLNRKMRILGLAHALSQRLEANQLHVVNQFHLETHKTKELVSILNEFGVGGKESNFTQSCYIVDWIEDGEEEENIITYGNMPVNLTVAAGNIPRIKVANQKQCNVFDILKYDKLILTLGAVRALEARLENKLY